MYVFSTQINIIIILCPPSGLLKIQMQLFKSCFNDIQSHFPVAKEFLPAVHLLTLAQTYTLYIKTVLLSTVTTSLCGLPTKTKY